MKYSDVSAFKVEDAAVDHVYLSNLTFSQLFSPMKILTVVTGKIKRRYDLFFLIFQFDFTDLFVFCILLSYLSLTYPLLYISYFLSIDILTFLKERLGKICDVTTYVCSLLLFDV